MATMTTLTSSATVTDDSTGATVKNSVSSTNKDSTVSTSSIGGLATMRSMAVQALALSVEEWKHLGRGDDPSVKAPKDLDVAVERITALMLVRIVAIVKPSGTYKDLSTSTICRQTLVEDKPFAADADIFTESLVNQVRCYIRTVLGKHDNELPFHNFQHTYHVVISANKLIDLMLSKEYVDRQQQQQQRPPPTFGLRNDPVLLAALLFAALVHAVDHRGVTNRQLALEGDKLAILYNDNSIQEQHSLHCSFETLLEDKYTEFYAALFQSEDDYFRFRRMVVDAVLSTDIANPERAQVSKSKWKEAFGEEANNNRHHRHRRSSIASNISMPLMMPSSARKGYAAYRRGSNASSVVSDVTTDSCNSTMMRKKQQQVDQHNRHFRRMSSLESVGDDCSIVYSHDYFANDWHTQNSNSTRSATQQHSAVVVQSQRQRQRTRHNRRASNQSVDSMYSDFAQDSVDLYNSKNQGGRGTARRFRAQERATARASRRTSTNTIESGDTPSAYNAMDSAAPVTPKNRQQQQQQQSRAPRRATCHASTHTMRSKESEMSFVSMAAESVGLAHKRQAGRACTRNRQRFDTSDLSDCSDGDGSDSAKANAVQDPDLDHHTFDDDEDSSLSLTPPSSEDELDGVVLTGVTLGKSINVFPPLPNPPMEKIDAGIQESRSLDMEDSRPATTPRRRKNRRASTGNASMRFGSLSGHKIDELCSDFEFTKNRYKKRLGIRRSMDLSGASIETYSQSGSTDVDGEVRLDHDEANALKAAVVFETLLRAADLAYYFQSFEAMTEWMSRIVSERVVAHESGRGHDPRPNLFDNQVRIIEQYLMPLTKRLDETGVFGEVGASFSQILDENLKTWLVEGYDLTLRFPLQTSEQTDG